MDQIIMYDIEGGLSDFFNFIEEKADEQEYKGQIEIEPLFKTDEETLDAELVQIILSGATTLIPLIIKLWDEYGKYKKTQKSFTGKIGKIEFKKDGQTIIIEGKDLSIEQIKQQIKQLTQNEK